MIAGNDTYMAMLKDALVQKEKALASLLTLTQDQEAALTPGEEDIDRFEAAFSKKDALIKQLDRLDRGFSDIYAKVQASLLGKKEEYKQEILELQALITGITDLSVKLQALEEKNRRTFEAFLMGKKQQIRDFKMNSRTASAYYKNMAGKPRGESYFMDKKK